MGKMRMIRPWHIRKMSLVGILGKSHICAKPARQAIAIVKNRSGEHGEMKLNEEREPLPITQKYLDSV